MKIRIGDRYNIGKIFLKVTRHGAYLKIKSKMEWDRRSSHAYDIDTILCVFLRLLPVICLPKSRISRLRRYWIE